MGDVAAARRALGPLGAFLPHSLTAYVPVGAQRAAARRFEDAGYGAVWVNDGPGKDALVQAAVLLAATERVVVGTGIANVWVRPPETAHAAASQLAEAYPDRFVLGLGVGYPGQAAAVGAEYGSPLATMRRYLERMGAPGAALLPAAPGAYARVVGANGPKMLALAAEVADGAVPAMVEPDATARAREVLGPEGLLVVLIDVTARDPAGLVAAHRAAGADHVVAMVPLSHDPADGVERIVALATDVRG